MVSPDVRSRSLASADPSGVGPAGHGAADRCRLVTTEAELETHLAIRQEVFVREQSIFAGSDRDERDGDDRTLHVLGLADGKPAGTVRLYPLDEPGLWKGDRLAVLGAYRHQHLGAPLVRFAVRTAAERGGQQMVAYVQPAAVLFFQQLGWQTVGGPTEYCGRPHQRMVIDLEPWRRRA